MMYAHRFWLLLALALTCACTEDAKPFPGEDGRTNDRNSSTDIQVPCAAASCMGCCMGGLCQPGNTAGACGTAAAPCQICQFGEECKAGSCAAKACDPTSCSTGCCDKSTQRCEQGLDQAACGKGGATCASCTTDQVCVEQACATKGPALYKITLVSAKVLVDREIACAGSFPELSDCDLYVVLTVGKSVRESSSIRDNNQPQWNEYMMTVPEAELLQSFSFEVRDVDPIGYYRSCAGTATLTAEDLAASTKTIGCFPTLNLYKTADVTFKFERVSG